MGQPDHRLNGYSETIQYGRYSSPASLAAGLAAMFCRDYCLTAGLYAKAGANQNQDLNVITFQMTNGQPFGVFNAAGPSNSFSFSPAGFGSAASVVDTGTVILQMGGNIIASTPYGTTSTSASVAQSLAAAVQSGSPVKVAADGANLYLTSKQAGAASNYAYTLSATTSNPTVFSYPSFASPTLSGNLSGGADQNAQGGTVYSYNAGYDATGNVVSINDSVMGSWTYGYDSLNRLTSGSAAATGTGPNAGQYLCWGYDSFGNRTAQSVSTTPCENSPPATLWANYSANNQIIKASTAPNGFGYDGAGDVTGNGTGATYLYDAEGRLCAVHGSQGMIGYQYNAEGNRASKGTIVAMSCDPVASGYLPTNDYVLDQSGGQVTETSVSQNGPVWQHTNIMANGMLMATYDTAGLHFYLNDPLGTRRAQTDAVGVPEQNCQSLPFGDQLNCTQNLVAPTEHHFTGKERDTESGLDYMDARYYGSNMGRFMSPDPSGGHLEDPQTLNRYAYAGNNPLTFSDPTGLDFYLQCGTASAAPSCAQQAVGLNVDGNKQMAWVQGVTNSDKTFTATRIGNDANGGLVDKTTGTGSYTQT